MNRIKFAAAILGVFALAVGMTAWLKAAATDPDALARRCAAAAPEWQRYQEDIKALGAGPVAQWHGSPVSATVSPAGADVVFELSPPWSDYEAALPILLRTPDGTVHQYASSTLENGRRTYHYDCFPEDPGAALPWIEIHYPHTERRLVLDPSGRWTATPDAH